MGRSRAVEESFCVKHSGSEGFFEFAKERHDIYKRRSIGLEKPWTNDPILQWYSFTNVYRELDRTTVWFRENIREPLNRLVNPRIEAATVAFRWFNNIRTASYILNEEKLGKRWFTGGMAAFSAEKHLRLMGPPFVSAAYIIQSKAGVDKLRGVLENIDPVFRKADWLHARITDVRTMEGASLVLQEFRGIGAFMAYEIVCDLRYTYVLANAPDLMTWANPGPGAARGLGRVFHNDVDRYNRHDKADRAEMIMCMQELLRESIERNWSPPWEMREVEHTLCEYDKYERTRFGEGRPKRRFNGGSEYEGHSG